VKVEDGAEHGDTAIQLFQARMVVSQTVREFTDNAQFFFGLCDAEDRSVEGEERENVLGVPILVRNRVDLGRAEHYQSWRSGCGVQFHPFDRERTGRNGGRRSEGGKETDDNPQASHVHGAIVGGRAGGRKVFLATGSATALSWVDGEWEGAIQVAAGPPRIAYVGHTGIDSCSTDPVNENGIWEPGETIQIPVDIRGGGDFTGVTGTLTSSTRFPVG
jgi:hypothetical protein